MSGRLMCVAVLLVAGCQNGLLRRGHHTACPPSCPAEVTAVSDQAACPPDGFPNLTCQPTVTHAAGPPALCAPKPQVEIRQGGEIRVNVPRQKVIVPRRPSAGAPAGVQTQAIEQQQIVQTRQVLLVPQQVLVPFVQTTTNGPIRVAGAQETQVHNFATITNATAQAGVINTVAGGAVPAPGQVNAAFAVAPAAPAAAAANGQAANPQSLQECLAQLRQYEQRIQQLTTTAERLSAQVEALSKTRRESNGQPLPPNQ